MSITTIHKALNNDLRITLKLARCEIEKLNAVETIQSRKIYATHFIENAPHNRKKCIFIDECGFNLHLRRSFGRAKTNQRVTAVVPTFKGRNVTLIAAMTKRGGVVHTNIISNSTCNSEKFCIFLKELIDLLDEAGDMQQSWLILDNASIHKTAMVRSIMARTPYKLQYLSPYSPMLNPIEQVFSKVKNTVRGILANKNFSGTLTNAIMQGVESVTVADTKGYVTHMENVIEKAKRGEPCN